jgi:hypothetical protein
MDGRMTVQIFADVYGWMYGYVAGLMAARTDTELMSEY